jgi:hypothetical protein
MNYTELYNAVIAETENTDSTFTDNIPVLVKNAEKRIYQAVKIPNLRKNATSYLQISNPYLTMPTDYLSTWEFATITSGVYAYLLPKDVSFIREAYPSTTTTGTPKYYAQFDDNSLLVAPTPSGTIQVELRGWVRTSIIYCCMALWLRLQCL